MKWKKREEKKERKEERREEEKKKKQEKLFSSTSIDRGIEIDRIDVGKSIFEIKGAIACAQAKNCSVPENRDASISFGKCSATHCEISIV